MKKTFLVAVLSLACCLPALSGGIWLKVSAGQATIGSGDYNRGVQGTNDLYRALYSSVNGVFSKLDRGLDLALEVGYAFSSRLGLGLSLGYLQAREEDTVEYDWQALASTYHDRITVKPNFHAFPLMANIRYSFPVGKVRLNFMAGAGVYLCRFSYSQDYTTTQFNWNYTYVLIGDKAVPAVHGGLGLEVPLPGRLSVVLDVLGRFARAEEIKGAWTLSGSLNGLDYSESGENQYFWFYDFKSGETQYPQTSFQEYEPKSYAITNARKGRFDFSGFVIAAGFKISL